MSVPVSKRGKSKLEPLVKAKDLSKHILLITNNEKKFTPNYKALTEDIVHCAENIYIDLWTANNIYAKGEINISARIDLQSKAIRNCSNLLALMDLAYSTFHLKSSSVEYVTKLTLETRESIKAWRDSDKKR